MRIRLALAGALAVAVPASAFACRPEVPVPTVVDQRFAGKVVKVDEFPAENLYRATIRAAGADGHSVTVEGALQYPCSESPRVQAGQWWRFETRRGKPGQPNFLVGLHPYCASGHTEANGAPNGYCAAILEKPSQQGRYRIAAGSSVVIGPERDFKHLHSAVLAAGSRFDSIALPAGTVMLDGLGLIELPKELSIGPIRLLGRLRLTNDRDIGFTSGHYVVQSDLRDGPGGSITLDGASVSKAVFSLPGFHVVEAALSTPATLQGYAVADYVRFAPNGSLREFRSARDQRIMGTLVRTCDNVTLIDGKPDRLPFYNPCASRRQGP